jgi:hypothetical protein
MRRAARAYSSGRWRVRTWSTHRRSICVGDAPIEGSPEALLRGGTHTYRGGAESASSGYSDGCFFGRWGRVWRVKEALY